MSRWIDADAFYQDICDSIEQMTKIGVSIDAEYLWAKLHDALSNAPSIDIVRCKECKYCVDAGAQGALVCDNSYIDMDIHPDDFCSYGEREGE